jgi:fused signal recognition particle receptor
MEPILLVVLLAAIVLGVTAGVVVTTRRRRGPELEPPKDRTRPTPSRPVDRGRPAAGDTTVADPTGADTDLAPSDELVEEVEEALAPVEAPRKRTVFERLARARSTFAGYVGSIVGRTKIDEETWDDLEEALVRADVGVGTATELLDDVRARVKAEGIESGEALVEAVKTEMKQRLAVADRSLRFDEGTTNVWLFVGVNGVGKTTTVGKVGHQQAAAGRTVVMAAGDTFRAAAAEQLTTWAERADATLIRGAEGADPSSIIFDAIESAAARGADLVLADTAGRLHTKSNLMEELRKVRRVASKPPGNVTEVLLVIDATTGQNGLVQARQFTEAVEVTGVVLTKLDGSAKGGIVFAIQSELGIPVKYVGLGETVDDLVAFDPDEFVDALFSE